MSYPNLIRMTKRIQVKAPARICFFGDHQDYLQLPVIAGTINRYIHIEGEPNTQSKFNFYLNDIQENRYIDLNNKTNTIHDGDYFHSALYVLRKAGFDFKQAYQGNISGTIPINAGLSSSSALVVAWIRFLLKSIGQEQHQTDEQIGRWAYEAEVRYFNQPGGLMDQYTIAQGGLLYIDTLSKQSERLNANLGALVIAESGLAKKTLSVLQNARSYGQAAIAAVQKKIPDFDLSTAEEQQYKEYLPLVPKGFQDHWYAAIHNHLLTQRAKAMLANAEQLNLEQLGSWMNEHQRILQERIQNTPKVMQQQLKAARKAGALGAKIIGSGGGGCMVAMVTETTKEAVIRAFLDAGVARAYEIELTSPE